MLVKNCANKWKHNIQKNVFYFWRIVYCTLKNCKYNIFLNCGKKLSGKINLGILKINVKKVRKNCKFYFAKNVVNKLCK